ncbi:TetR/AcrR family transcriptional regulator [Coleofasciculus sp.]|uniref:TetR/AcrR family transcriptional regulator n=1 Tax=Coleofasciculus sp. TaxID=3100458 RepID=UPI0039F8C3C6
MSRSKNSESNRKSRVDKAEQILNGATQEFLKHGYAATSMDRVAAAAKVSKQTLYSYFQDKETLFTTLIERMAKGRFQLVFGSVPLQGEPQTVLRQLVKTGLSRIATDQEYLSFVRVVIAESGRFPHLAQVFVSNITKPALETLTLYFASHPQLKIADPQASARIFVGSIIAFVLTQEVLHGKELMPMDSDRLIDSLIHSVLHQ